MSAREFQRESEAWTDEVNAEAARLVRQGVPPFDAIIRARDIVSRRRAEKARRVTREGER